MNRIRLACVGCGNMASEHQRHFNHIPDIELVAVCDLDEKKARLNEQKFGAKNFYTDYRQMLDREKLDAVVVCGHPVTMHRDIGIEVLDRGLHMFVEKPVGHTAADCRAVRNAAKKNNRLVMVGTMWRHQEVTRRARKLMERQDFGVPNLFHVGYYAPTPRGSLDKARALMLDQGVHPLDCSLYLLGPIKTVTARASTTGTESLTINAQLEFTSGLVGSYQLSNIGPTLKQDIVLGGDQRGRIHISQMSRLEYYHEKPWEGAGIYSDEAHEVWECRYRHRGHNIEGHADEWPYFIACLQKNEQPHASLDDHLLVMSTMEAILASLESGKNIAVEND